MVITYYGLSCFKIQSGDIALVFDLPAKKSEFKAPRFHADIAIESHSHPGHGGASEISLGHRPTGEAEDKNTFLINGPGEYEVKGIFIQGIKTFHDPVLGKKRGVNIIYVVQMENVKLCFLGDYGERDLRPEVKEAIGKIDILFAPIGGESVLEPEASKNLLNQLEPAIAIPMHYDYGKNALKDFLAECGQKDIKPVEKFSIKKKDIPENKGTEVVILSAV